MVAPLAPLAAWLLATGGASGADSGPPDRWGPRLEATADAPLLYGGRAGLDLPGGLRFGAGVGWVPRAWLARAEELALDASSDADRSADEASLSLWRVRAGWRPSTRLGLYAEGGYARGAYAGDLPADLVGEATGLDLPQGFDPGARFAVAATLHLAEAEVGWEADLGEAATVRLGLLWMSTLAAAVTAAPSSFTPDDRVATVLDPALERVSSDLEAILEDRVRLPLFVVGLGLRL